MLKETILTGLRANDDLHLGNYFGALLPLVRTANENAGKYTINLFVPDLHSFTTPIDHKLLHSQIVHNLKLFVASGLNINDADINIYRQSYVPAHSELAIILSNFTGFGEMSRMTQFKDRINKLSDERVSVGLFQYPILMAADILLYEATLIPVGEDQTQHLEFTRDIAERFNAKFGNIFKVPKPVKEQISFFNAGKSLRIRNLTDPTKKMSKSDDSSKGIIFLSDTPEVAKSKIMGAETDSISSIDYDYKNQPGISNLLDILDLLGGNPHEFIKQSNYGELKSAVAEKVMLFLTAFQSKLASVDENLINKKLADSEVAINKIANSNLNKIQKAIGLR